MSLEIAAVSDKFAVVVSDGLEWTTDGRIVREDACKQIQLGPNICVAAGGYAREMAELFAVCQAAYCGASEDERSAAVKFAFRTYLESKTFPGFGETCLGGLLVTKEPDGFTLIKQHSGGKP